MHYYIYIGITIAVLGILSVIAVIALNRNSKRGVEAEQETRQNVATDTQTTEMQAKADTGEEVFLADAVPEINELIKSYYVAYASGNIKELEQYATPVSELEKGYIKLISKYTESIDNVHCYIKDGLEEGEYAVSAATDMQMKGIGDMAPGLDFFYIRTDENGAYYIDNLYSSFNLSVHVLDVDRKVTKFIDDYQAQDNFRTLQDTVQTRYDEIMASNAELGNKLLKEIPQAVNEWMDTLMPPDKEGAAKDVNDVIPGAALISSRGYTVRKSMGKGSKKLGTVKKGDKIMVADNYKNGWTKVKWKGRTGYIKTGLLVKN